MLYVLNMAVSVVDDQALHSRAETTSLSAEERSRLRLDTTTPTIVDKAHDLEAIIVAALRVAGCTVDWVRVDHVQSASEPTILDDQDVTFLRDDRRG